MILELITCDGCDWTDPMPSSVVPGAWIVADGHHYCSPACRTRAEVGDAE